MPIQFIERRKVNVHLPDVDFSQTIDDGLFKNVPAFEQILSRMLRVRDRGGQHHSGTGFVEGDN
jgi:hypothetical protein